MSAESGNGSSASRKAFLAFARRHHPDVGGDPAVFVAGLKKYQSTVEFTTADFTTVEFKTADFTKAAGRQETAEQKTELSRFDAPISFAPKAIGLGAAKQKFTRWREKKKQPPRVR